MKRKRSLEKTQNLRAYKAYRAYKKQLKKSGG